jgi:hypothetical protein
MTMADAPVDGYSKIIMVISQIRLLSDGGQDVIVLDQPKQVDFLALSNFSEVLLKREVVAGTFSKIRLILDSLTLVKPDGSTDVVQLNGLQKIDINPQGTFEVRGGEDIIINVDLDLNRSIHIVTAGNSNTVLFRPVIFAAISSQRAFDKLFRVEGTIDSINAGPATMSVCDIRHVSDDGAKSPNPMDVCVFTDPNSNTNYFDQDANPMSAGLGGLAVNDPVVMYGKFDPAAATDTFIPAVIAMGSRDTFVRERGISGDFVPDATDSTAPGTMNLDEVNPLCVAAPAQRELSVASQTAVFSEDENANATRIDRTAIAKCRATETEGFVANAGTADEILRSFVVIQGSAIEEELAGSLATTATTDKYMLTPTAQPAADQCVVLTNATVIIQIQTVSGVATVTTLTTPPLGVEVSVTGATRDANNCLVATHVIREM